MNKDKLSRSLIAASLAMTMVTSNTLPMLAKDTKAGQSGTSQTEQASDQTKEKKDANETDQKTKNADTENDQKDTNAETDDQKALNAGAQPVVDVTDGTDNNEQAPEGSDQEDPNGEGEGSTDGSQSSDESQPTEETAPAEEGAEDAASEEEAADEQAESEEEKQAKAAGSAVTVNGDTITINGDPDNPYVLTSTDMASLGNLTGKTLEINGLVQFPGNVDLTQTTVRGVSGNDGVWFGDQATQGFIINGDGSTIEEVWIHGRTTVSNGTLTVKSYVDFDGGNDANPSVVLNNGSITYPTGDVTDCTITGGLASTGTSSMSVGTLSFQNGGANNGISVNSGSLRIGPMERLELDGDKATFGFKVADGASVTIANCPYVSIQDKAGSNFTAVQLGAGSTFNVIDSPLNITTNTGTAFSGGTNSTVNLETSDFKSNGTVNGGLIKGATLNVSNGNFEVLGITGWEANPTTAPMNFSNATVAFQGQRNNGSMGCHLGADMTLTNSSFVTTGGALVPDMTGINLVNGAVLTVKNSELNVNGVYGAAIKGDGSLVIDNENNEAVQLDGTNRNGKNIQLGAGKFIIKNGYVFVDGNTSLTYDQYKAGDTHPGMDNDAVNANGDPIYPFVIEGGTENEVKTLHLIDNQGTAYDYTYSVQEDTLTQPHGNRAYVWAPVATVNFFGQGTVDGTQLSDTTATPYKQLFLRGTTPSVAGITLPQATLANKTFAGWRPKNDPNAAPSMDPVLTAGTNDLVAVYDAKQTNVILSYVDDQGNVIKTTTTPITVTDTNPKITEAQLNADMPQYYTLKTKGDITVPTADFDKPTTTINVTVVPEQWTVTLNYTENGTSVGTKNVDLTPAKGLKIDAKTVQDNVPKDYKLVTPGVDVAVTKDKETIDVPVVSTKAKVTAVTLKYVDAQGKEIAAAKNPINVEDTNPTITVDEQKAQLPKYYKLQAENPISLDPKTDFNNPTKTVNVVVVPVQWTVTLNYTDNGASVATKDVDLMPADGTDIDAKTVQDGVPTGYKLVKTGAVTAANDKQTIDVPVQKITTAVTLRYMDNGKEIKTSKPIQVAQLTPTITADQLKAELPQYYTLKKDADITVPAADFTKPATTIDVDIVPVQWTITLNYTDNGTQVGTKAVTLTPANGTSIDVQTVEAGVPADYKLAMAMPVTATKDNETINVPVISTKAKATAVTLRYVDENGKEIEVGKAAVNVVETNPTITADELKAQMPQYYVLKEDKAITVPANAFNNPVTTIDVTIVPVQWTITLNYTDNGKSVATKNVTLTPLNGRLISAQTVQDGVPADYELVTPGAVTAANDQQTIDVPVRSTKPVVQNWNVSIEYSDGNKTVGTYKATVKSDNPVVSAADIEKNVPKGYELTSKATDLTFAADGDTHTVAVKAIVTPPAVQTWNVTVQYTDGSKTVGTYKATIKSDNAVVSAADIEKNVPKGYELTSKAKDLTFKADGETQKVAVKAVVAPVQDWTVTIQYSDNKKAIVGTYKATVKSNNPVVSAADIEKNVPKGYELTSPAKDLRFKANGETQSVAVKAVSTAPAVQEWKVSIQYMSGKDIIKTFNTTVKSDNAIVSAAEIEKNVPQGYELVSKAADVTFKADGAVQNIEVKKIASTTPAAQEWSVELTFKDKTSHETVGQATINVSASDPKLTAAQIKAAVPEGYVLVKEPTDTTLRKDLFKNGKTGLIFTVEKKADNTKASSNTNTSAHVNTGLWVGLSAGAAAAIGALVHALKRKNKQ